VYLTLLRQQVHDHRLEALHKLTGSQRIVPSRLEFVDIAGLVSGASKGEGLGNQFLANIRACDAIVHLVRGFVDPEVGRGILIVAQLARCHFFAVAHAGYDISATQYPPLYPSPSFFLLPSSSLTAHRHMHEHASRLSILFFTISLISLLHIGNARGGNCGSAPGH